MGGPRDSCRLITQTCLAWVSTQWKILYCALPIKAVTAPHSFQVGLSYLAYPCLTMSDADITRQWCKHFH
jgi:hypothetical protein